MYSQKLYLYTEGHIIILLIKQLMGSFSRPVQWGGHCTYHILDVLFFQGQSKGEVIVNKIFGCIKLG